MRCCIDAGHTHSDCQVHVLAICSTIRIPHWWVAWQNALWAPNECLSAGYNGHQHNDVAYVKRVQTCMMPTRMPVRVILVVLEVAPNKTLGCAVKSTPSRHRGMHTHITLHTVQPKHL